MPFVLPAETETHIHAGNGMIVISQVHFDGDTDKHECVCLTVHQFTEILKREQSIVRTALGATNEL